tara:strand:+ start:1541 stop:4015 length:2475 start_codon:yes stop_codon:yes gene_type:complete
MLGEIRYLRLVSSCLVTAFLFGANPALASPSPTIRERIALAQSINPALAEARRLAADGNGEDSLRIFESVYARLSSTDGQLLFPFEEVAALYEREGRVNKAVQFWSDYIRLLGTGGSIYEDHLTAGHIELLRRYATALVRMGKTRAAEQAYSDAWDYVEVRRYYEHPQALALNNEYATFLLDHPVIDPKIDPAGFALAHVQDLRNATDLRIRTDNEKLEEKRQSNRAFELYVATAGAVATRTQRRTGDIKASAFEAAQERIHGPAGQAVVQMAVEKMLSRTSPELGDLPKRRTELSRRITEMDSRYFILKAEFRDKESEVYENILSAAVEKNMRPDQYQAKIAGRTDKVEAEIRALEEAREQLANEMVAIDDQLFALAPNISSFSRAQPLSEDEAQDLLRPDEAVLMIVPTDWGTSVFLVNPTSVTWHQSAMNRTTVDSRVRRLLWDVGANVDVTPEENEQWSDQGEGAYPFDRSTAYSLYRELVLPFDSQLTQAKYLYVVAVGSLSSLPFGMLVTEQPEGEDGSPDDLRRTDWLADKFVLGQMPSLQSFSLLRQMNRVARTENNPVPFTGFGDPVLQGKAAKRGTDGKRLRSYSGPALPLDRYGNVISGADKLQAIRQLAKLPGTAIEIRALQRNLGASDDRVYLEERATEKILRGVDFTRSAVVAFATHGLLAGEIAGNMEPALVLTPPEFVNGSEDGLLTMSEIASLRLNADWIILSACNTAAGDGSEGAAGLSGLARSFFYAGASSLLASHWPVRDDVAPLITVNAVKLEKEGNISRGEALQRAMRDIRNDPQADSSSDTWAHPSVWAPFSLIGEVNSLP